jgi:CBS domain-containing protein
LATLLLWLGPLNLLLGVFNLIPGFPLDGGRVLRSILWAVTRDLTTATRWASRVGQVFAWVLITIGAMNAFAGNIAQGLWLILIGWFLNHAARMSYQQLLVQRALGDVTVSRVMRTRLARVPPELSVESLVRDYFMADDVRVVTVESGGTVVGMVSASDVRSVPQERWTELSASSIMTPLEDLTCLPSDAPANRAFEEIARLDLEELPVVESGRVVGVVSGQDLIKWLALQGVRLP